MAKMGRYCLLFMVLVWLLGGSFLPGCEPGPTTGEPRCRVEVPCAGEAGKEATQTPERDAAPAERAAPDAAADGTEPVVEEASEPAVDAPRETATEPGRDGSTGPDNRPEPPTPSDEFAPEPTKEAPPEPVADRTPWLPTWQDDPCAKAPAPGYGSTIARWVGQDQLRAPPQGGIVVTGSSSIRLWKRMQIDLSQWQAIQRGYGGSLLWDAVGHAAKIISPYKPRLVLVYAGTNDISKGTSPDDVLLAYRCLVQRIRKGIGHVHIAFIGITPNPARWSQWAKSTKVNDGVKALANAWPGLHYIDIPTAFLKTGQPPDASLFVSDRLHLNDKGYTLWTSVIRPALRQIAPPRTYQAPTGQPGSGSRALIDLGPSNAADGDPTKSPDTAGNHWNSWHALEGGTSTLPGEALGLKTTTGQTTPWRLVLGGQFLCNGKLNGGLLSPDPKALGALAVATATQDYFYVNAGDGAQPMTIDGLDPTKTYELTLFASRSTDQETRVTQYSVHSGTGIASQQLTTTGRDIGSDGSYDGNDSKVVTFSGLKPLASGKIHLEIRAAQGSYGYLAALSLQVK